MGEIENEVSRGCADASAAARSGNIDGASEALNLVERKLSKEPDQETALARVCILHTELLLEASRRRGIEVPTIHLRELALRKATRAVSLAGGAKSEALNLAACRARTDALRSIPGRDRAWRESAATLMAMLERAPTDTRRERAERWQDLGGMAAPWAHDDERERFSREEGAPAEDALRRALALYLSCGEEAVVDAVSVLASLANLLAHCGAFTAIDELVATASSALPRKSVELIRTQADQWASSPGGERITEVLRRVATGVDERRATIAPAAGAAPSPQALTVGARVLHAKYGEGTVLTPPAGERRIVEVGFDDGTNRKLLEGVVTRTL